MRRVFVVVVFASILIPAGIVQAQEIVIVEGAFTQPPEGTYEDENIKIVETTDENSVLYEATAGGGPASGTGRLVTITEVTQGACVQTYRSTFVVTYTGTWEPQSLSFDGTWTATFDHVLVSESGDCDGVSYGKTFEPLSGQWNALVDASSGTVTDKKVNLLPILSVDGDTFDRLVTGETAESSETSDEGQDSTSPAPGATTDSSETSDEGQDSTSPAPGATTDSSGTGDEDQGSTSAVVLVGGLVIIAVAGFLVIAVRRRSARGSGIDLADPSSPREPDVADYLRDAPPLKSEVADPAPRADALPEPHDTGSPVTPDVPSNLDPDDVIGTFLLQLSVVATVNQGAGGIVSGSVDRLAESHRRLFPNGWTHVLGPDAPGPGDVIEGAARGDQEAVDRFVETIRTVRERQYDVAEYLRHASEQPGGVAPALPASDDETLGDPAEEDADPFEIPPLDLGLTWRPDQEPEAPANPWTAVDQRLGDMATGSDLENVEADFQLLEDVITSICLQAAAMAVAQHGEQATDPEDAASRLR